MQGGGGASTSQTGEMETELVDLQTVHPPDPNLEFFTVLPIDFTKNKKDLLEREVWWQENVGVHKFGLNKRNDLATVSRKRKKQPCPVSKTKGYNFFSTKVNM